MASSSQSTLLGLESLPLFKLSFCTTATLQSKMMWTHLPHRDSMFAVFDQIRKTGLGGLVFEKKILKLIHGGDLLVRLTVLCFPKRHGQVQHSLGSFVFLYCFPDMQISRSRSTLMIWRFKYASMRKECDHSHYRMLSFM